MKQPIYSNCPYKYNQDIWCEICRFQPCRYEEEHTETTRLLPSEIEYMKMKSKLYKSDL